MTSLDIDFRKEKLMRAKTPQSCADTLAKMEALLQVVNVYLEVGAQGSLTTPSLVWHLMLARI